MIKKTKSEILSAINKALENNDWRIEDITDMYDVGHLDFILEESFGLGLITVDGDNEYIATYYFGGNITESIILDYSVKARYFVNMGGVVDTVYRLLEQAQTIADKLKFEHKMII